MTSTLPRANQPSVADLLTDATRTARSSVIREILELTEAADVLSMAGGMPSPDSFPVDELADAVTRAVTQRSAVALQYARTDGITELRTLLADQFAVARGRACGADEVVITTGSQQALDLIGRAFLSPGDTVAMEIPGYLGAIQAFGTQNPRWLHVPVDDDGLDTDALAAALAGGERPKLVYTATDFQNPTGAVLTEARRRHLAALADEFGFIVVEDDPYGAIRFDTLRLAPVSTYTDRCISLSTTSKTVAPGLRLGWLFAPPVIAAAVARLKQATDLNTSALAQSVIFDLYARPDWLAQRADRLTTFYAPRATRLEAALRQAVPGIDLLSARGGLFLWARLPGINTTALLPTAVAGGVAFVPGGAFTTDGATTDSLRVSFATLSDADLETAASRLGAVVGTLG